MQLHELKIKKARSSRRIGRGGKRGTTSGRGQKGQKSRAGHRIRPAAHDLLIRLPKLRGFKNKPSSVKPLVLNICDLMAVKPKLAPLDFKISPETLKKIGFLPAAFRGKIKLLGRGGIDFSAVISGLQVSRGAEEKIKKAGGKIET